MTPVQYLLIGFVGVGLLIGLTWRMLSRRFEIPCPSWLAWLVELDNPFLKIYRASEITTNLGLVPGMRVLNAGCGPGRFTLPAAEKVGEFGEVWALDIQDKMLDRVREKIHRAGIEYVHILQAELGSGALPDDYFDRALLVTVLGEIPDQHGTLKEIHRSLHPGAASCQ